MKFDAIDYSKLELPDAIETWGFDAILAARMQDYLARWAQKRIVDPTLPPYDVEQLESDPAKILQEADAYREGLLRQRINDAIRATYLASAQLDNDIIARAAEYLTTPAAGETMESLRKRAQLAWENLSIGGSYGGYQYQALSVAPADISDVAVWGYEVHETALFGSKAISDFPKGEVRVALLGANGQGAVSTALIARVQATLSDRARRKVNDKINVVPATLLRYVVSGTLVLKRGADPAPIVAEARRRAFAYGAATRVIGVEATRGGYFGALMAAEPGLIVDVELDSPAAAIGGGPCEAPILTGVNLAWRYAS